MPTLLGLLLKTKVTPWVSGDSQQRTTVWRKRHVNCGGHRAVSTVPLGGPAYSTASVPCTMEERRTEPFVTQSYSLSKLSVWVEVLSIVTRLRGSSKLWHWLENSPSQDPAHPESKGGRSILEAH